MARRDLPPLSSLPSFEAAARLSSFSKAADELHVTHGAVSRAIRRLEDSVGTPLFHRSTRLVSLTATGAVYAAEVRGVLNRLAAATTLAGGADASGILAISTMDSFAAKWLVPRLFRFRRAHSDIDIRVSTSEAFADFVSDGIDIAIRHGQGHYPGLVSDLLLKEDLFPVCSPKLLEGPHPLRSLSDLAFHTLIHDEFHIDWATWLMTAGVEGVDPHQGPKFHASALAVQAAVMGEGVVLGRSTLVADDLASGRLIRPFTFSVSAGSAFHLVYPLRALQRQKVVRFREWILAEVGADAGSRARASDAA